MNKRIKHICDDCSNSAPCWAAWDGIEGHTCRIYRGFHSTVSKCRYFSPFMTVETVCSGIFAPGDLIMIRGKTTRSSESVRVTGVEGNKVAIRRLL